MRSFGFRIKLAAVYALFLIGALLAGALVLPLAPGLKARSRIRRRRALVQAALRCYLALLRRVRVLDLQVIGGDIIAERGGVAIANHPTLFDALILLSLHKNAVCIVKRSLRFHPCYALSIRLLGYPGAELDEHALGELSRELREGTLLVVFPEGTRTTAAAHVNRFHRGAASFALRAQVPIIPVYLDCSPRIFGAGSHWWDAAALMPRVVTRVTSPLPVPPATLAEIPGASRDLTTELELSYNRWLAEPRESLTGAAHRHAHAAHT